MKKIQYKIDEITLIQNISNKLFVINNENMEIFTKVYNNCVYNYADFGYHYLPIYVEDNEEYPETRYTFIMANLFWRYFTPYINILKELDSDTRIINLKYKKTVTDGRQESINKEYNNTITTNDTNKDAGETAPITADINTIDTPNYKSHSINDKTSSKTGEDVDTHTYSGNIEENNPELFKMYMELYREYNIFEIVDKCYRKIIAEFNASL